MITFLMLRCLFALVGTLIILAGMGAIKMSQNPRMRIERRMQLEQSGTEFFFVGAIILAAVASPTFF